MRDHASSLLSDKRISTRGTHEPIEHHGHGRIFENRKRQILLSSPDPIEQPKLAIPQSTTHKSESPESQYASPTQLSDVPLA